MKILLVDDEESLLRTVQLGWPEPDDEIVTARSFEEAKRSLLPGRAGDFDCIILDLQLPDASGTTILSEVRKRTDTPVIMLSAWGDTQFRADTLMSGADDDIMKPVGIRELHARTLKAALLHRKRSSPKPSVIAIGNCEFHVQAQLLKGETHTTKLTGAEASLLEELALANGEPVLRTDLYLKVFQREAQFGDKSLETYVSRLRRLLNEHTEDGAAAIRTIRGVGYRLVA
ncbi:response regulator transcription factor [Henriciella pelagia]|uniref:response regulator transcription factor n=1 Tax=Henriciella pelagia TaxID=1977912 RepID=UPI0035160FF3